MPVVRCRDRNGIDILALQQLPDVGVAFELGAALLPFGHFGVQDDAVNVAQAGDAHTGDGAEALQMVAAPAAEADDGHANFVTGT